MRIYTALRYFLLFEVLRRLQRGDATFWTPPGTNARLRQLVLHYRTEKWRRYGALLDEFNAELGELSREEGPPQPIEHLRPRFRVERTGALVAVRADELVANDENVPGETSAAAQ